MKWITYDEVLTIMNVGLFYNLREDFENNEHCAPKDIIADWDVKDTIEKIKDGLRFNNYNVLDLKDPNLLINSNIIDNIDIVFSICEMQGYRYRESLVPSLCEIIKIPYVFSSPDTLMISLDKNLCNFITKQSGCNVPNWFFINHKNKIISSMFNKYPYILKPSAEGSGIGITSNSVVFNFHDLKERSKYLLSSYNQPILIQEYIEGNEITIGLVENNHKIMTFTALEISPLTKIDFAVYGYNEKENADKLFQFKPFNADKKLLEQIKRLAIKAFLSIGCKDAARVDIRVSNDKIPYFIEINPLPHLHPIIGDFCRSAKASEVSYPQLIKYIMMNVIRRYNLN